MKNKKPTTEKSIYAVSIAKFDTGMNMKYMKRTGGADQNACKVVDDVSNVLIESIYLTLDIFQCQREIPVNVIANIKENALRAIDSVSITTKINYLRGSAIFTLYLCLNENGDNAMGLFWRFPIGSNKEFISSSN